MQSRYYNSEVGRFLNADEAELLFTCNENVISNLYACCVNNPANNSDRTGRWVERVVGGIAGAAIFAALAYTVCDVISLFVNISKKTIAATVAAFALLGGIIGAVFGPSFIAKHSTRMMRAIRGIEKRKFSVKPFGPTLNGNIFGITISGVLIIMLHAPHPKYNEWFFHLQVEVKPGRRQFEIWKCPIIYVDMKSWKKKYA